MSKATTISIQKQVITNNGAEFGEHWIVVAMSASDPRSPYDHDFMAWELPSVWYESALDALRGMDRELEKLISPGSGYDWISEIAPVARELSDVAEDLLYAFTGHERELAAAGILAADRMPKGLNVEQTRKLSVEVIRQANE